MCVVVNFNNIFCNELFVIFLMQKFACKKTTKKSICSYKNEYIEGDVEMAPPWSYELKVVPIIFVIMSVSMYFYEENAGLMKEQI